MPSKKSNTPPAGPRLVGYARVSTAEQNLDMQIEALRAAGVHEDNIWAEKVSAASSKRPKLAIALMDAREGDTFVVWKLDRVSRSLLDLLEIMKDLDERKIDFKSLTEGFDTKTPAGRLLVNVIGSLAQFERDLIRERTKAGVAAYRERGGQIGQPRKLSDVDVVKIMKRIEKGETVRDLAKEYSVAPGTIYNAIKGTISALQGKPKRAKPKAK